MTRTRARAGAALVAALVTTAALAAGCTPATPAPRSAGSGPSGTVTILAAASLTDVFEQIAADLMAEHPDLEVVTAYAGSSSLAAQVLAGAPADVLATASAPTMQPVLDAGAAASADLLARNSLTLVVPAGNPGRVSGLADLADPGRTVALCAPQVPCGAAAEALLAAAGVVAAPDTLEQDVRAVLTKVELGEVDAGLVYRTDVRAAGDAVEEVVVPEAASVTTDYLVAALTDAPNPDGAAAFVAAVLSPEGREVLADAGFTLP